MKIISREIVPLVYDKVDWRAKWRKKFFKIKMYSKLFTGRLYKWMDKVAEPVEYPSYVLSLLELTTVKPKDLKDYLMEHEIFNEKLKREEAITIRVDFQKSISSTHFYPVVFLHTEPKIKGLHSELFTIFFYQNDNEVFYQRIIPDQPGVTELIGIKKGTDTVRSHGKISGFYLNKIDEKENCILGFNEVKGQTLKLCVEW